MTGERPSPERRALEEPGRYEVSILIGPCTLAEAEGLAARLSAFCAGQLGAVLSLSTFDDEAGAD